MFRLGLAGNLPTKTKADDNMFLVFPHSHAIVVFLYEGLPPFLTLESSTRVGRGQSMVSVFSMLDMYLLSLLFKGSPFRSTLVVQDVEFAL